MKTIRAFLVFGLALLPLGSAHVRAQSVPSLVNYQGRLTDQTGAALPAGNYTIQFRLWDSPTSTSNLIWAQQQTIAVQGSGVFNVILGAPGGAQIPDAAPAVNSLTYAFANSNCFLGVTVLSRGGTNVPAPTEISPRQQLMSVPFAMQAQQASSLVSNLANALCPPGTVVAYMGTNAPPGWLLCDGSLVERTNYAALFGVLGTASGSGDGSTTFNLPDMRGVFLRGVAAGQTNTLSLDPDSNSRIALFVGGNVGNMVGSFQGDMFASHTHQYADYAIENVPPPGFADGDQANNGNIQRTTDATGGNETRPKNVYVNYIIKY